MAASLPEAAQSSIYIGRCATGVAVLALIRLQGLIPAIQLLIPGLLQSTSSSAQMHDSQLAGPAEDLHMCTASPSVLSKPRGSLAFPPSFLKVMLQ